MSNFMDYLTLSFSSALFILFLFYSLLPFGGIEMCKLFSFDVTWHTKLATVASL